MTTLSLDVCAIEFSSTAISSSAGNTFSNEHSPAQLFPCEFTCLNCFNTITCKRAYLDVSYLIVNALTYVCNK